MKKLGYGILVSLAALSIAGGGALADCADPVGKAGEIVFNGDVQIMQFCNGTDWISMGGNTQGCPVGGHGKGYFVLTDGTWQGINAGPESNADALCLADLTANDWMGKTDAQARGLLDSSHVRGFLCSKSTCNQALANTEYFFAVSGDPAKGGASFTTDETGMGPNNAADWSGASYFDGNKSYWTGRTDWSGGILWGNGHPDGNYNCNNWGSPGVTARIGESSHTDEARWHHSSRACNSELHHLVCFVHP